MGDFKAGNYNVETDVIQEQGTGRVTGLSAKVFSNGQLVCTIIIAGSPPSSKITEAIEILDSRGELVGVDLNEKMAEELKNLG